LSAKKKRPSSTEKELKTDVKKLRSKLERADAKADRWKKKAARLQKAAARSEAQVKKLEKRLGKATRAAEQPAPDAGTGEATSAVVPDETWTVAQLRAEARDRGLTGLSGKPKAELLAALG
jgi:chromosome segregation ATPase